MKKKAAEIRALGDVELQARIGELKKELYGHACVSVGSDNKKCAGKRQNSRREIARILTIQTEREIASWCCVE